MTQIGKSTGGVLQIPAAATQKNAPTKKAPKPPAPRLKLLVRRLPPGLTEEEFRNAVGEEWTAGAGKVDWFQYRPGKVSKDPAKPSRPSRAYIHVVSSDHIAPLADKVRQTSFLDAQNTANDPILLGPPSVEFAPYAKIPGNRVRKDARQGTIDQDPDFFAFLESLTQPITKPSVESTESEEKKETMTTTPLVQYIKDKKANKAKEQTSSKSSRKSEKEAKPDKVQAKKLLQRPDREIAAPATEKMEKKSKSDKATKEAVKAANKAANVAAKQSGRATPTAKETPTAPASERKRERGNAAAAAKILQRDLGLSSSGGRRKGGKGSEADAKKENALSTPTEPSKKEAKPPKQPKGKASETTPQPSEPSTPQPQATPPASAPAAKPAKPSKGKQPTASPSATSTQAFLKHANPSQGVTEPLLETAFSPFGKVVSVEIDKKKGFGYVDFAEPTSLQKAIAASPVTVAQSQVVVLERKTNPGGDKPRKGRGGGAAGGGEQAVANSGNGNSNGSARGGKPEGSGGGGSSRGRGGRGRNRGGNKPEKEKA